MYDIRFPLKPLYSNSRALIIGIDSYKSVQPLSHAVSDAEGFRDTIIEKLNFSPDNITCLLNEDATKDSILRSFLEYAQIDIDYDERILVFFAGHGHTVTGGRGEVGFLVPYDADIDDLSSLIRWNELTGGAELIRAKHMMFIMDACYSGLALQRSIGSGTTRFLKDMLKRYTRQVLTAGKADETVSDADGPIPNHSVFTGHLINGLNGEAATDQGIISANGLMSYVYTKVANDPKSKQTPHYGCFEGDGDFILNYTSLNSDNADHGKDMDKLIVIPAIEEDEFEQNLYNKIKKVKKLLSDNSSTIELHDYLVSEVQIFLSRSTEDHFSTHHSFSSDELQNRLTKYEEISLHMTVLLLCVAHWGNEVHLKILQKMIGRAMDSLELRRGSSLWYRIHWYPMITLMYYLGIAAVAGGRFDSLLSMFSTPVAITDSTEMEETFLDSVRKAMLELAQSNMWEKLPGLEKQYTPLSEYLYELLQPIVDDVLFTGKSYDNLFDEFEVHLALAMSDAGTQLHNSDWGHIGRFGWKQFHYDKGPLLRIIENADRLDEKWEPLKAGLFGGDILRFLDVAKGFQARIQKLNWL